MDKYYSQTQYIAKLDKNNNIIGKVEKWEAHKKIILHRGFTAVIIIDNKFLIQQRKHPVFDSVFDISFSSHPIYKNKTLQDEKEAVIEAFEREWISKEKLSKEKIIYKGNFYYKAKDPKSDYGEHEIDSIFEIRLKEVPQSNFDYSYGHSVIEKDVLLKKNSSYQNSLAPWVKKMIEMKML